MSAAPTRRDTARNVVQLAVGTTFLLSVPLLAMQLSDQVSWSPFDFIAAGSLLFFFGLAYLLVTRRVSSRRKRIAIGAAFVLALVLVWIELAVGIFGTPIAGS